MSVHKTVKQGWKRSSVKLTGTDWFWRRTAGTLVLGQAYYKIFKEHARGRLLDAGAGTLSGRHMALNHCDQYESIDFEKTHPELDYVGDVQHLPLNDNSFDTVLSLQVLEHVPDPSEAMREMRRVLKIGGTAIVSVPFYWYLHNEPNDYWRYTKHGLRTLFKKTDLEVVSLEPLGGLISFLHHLFFTAVIGTTYSIPALGTIVLYISYITAQIAIELDRWCDPKRLFPLYYIAIVKK